MAISDHDPQVADTQALARQLHAVYSSEEPVEAATLAAAVDQASRLRNAEALTRNTARVGWRAPRLAAAVLAAAALSVFAGIGVAGALNGMFAPQAGQRLLVDDAASVWTPPPVVPSTPVAVPSVAKPPLTQAQPKPARQPPKPKVAPKPVSDDHEAEHSEDDHEDHHDGDDEHESDD